MKRIINLRSLRAIALATSLIVFPISAMAQRGSANIKTDTKILYHGGPVMTGSTDVYLIWYGNWSTGGDTKSIITDFVSRLGSSTYFQINTGYTDSTGAYPNGALLYAGSVNDEYSHGPSLPTTDIQEIVAQHIEAGDFPLDTTGIYLVLATPDVTDIQPNGSMYCSPPGTFPHHGVAPVFGGVPVKYGFIGHPSRCPTSVGSQFDGGALPTPNDNFAADVMVSTIAHVLNALVTNPAGTGWFDRYGFENAAKCYNTFGETYTTSNGARANMRLGARHYLIQQNWVNARRGYCALAAPEP